MMTGLIRTCLICIALFWFVSLSGCARIYCYYCKLTAPKMTQLGMFEWPPFSDGQEPSGIDRGVEIRPTDHDNKWLLLDWDSFNPYASRAVVVASDGSFVEISKLPDELFDPNRIKFNDSPTALKEAGVMVTFDEGEYSRYLELEAWSRAIVGYPLLPFMGKSAGRVIEGDYWHRRLHCYPPRAKVSVQSVDGSNTTTVYELRTPANKLHPREIGAMISDDRRFLYIHIQDWGGLVPLHQAE